MGKQQKVHPSGVPEGSRPYSLGVRHGDLLFVAGQVGQDFSTGKPAAEDFDGQVRAAIENVKRILEAGGSSLDKVVNVNCWVTDMSKWARMNEIYLEYFNTDPRPPRATVGAALVPPYQFEIAVIAYVGD
jgi:2-iminobutanoate/2-iminopropanoate deaminase